MYEVHARKKNGWATSQAVCGNLKHFFRFFFEINIYMIQHLDFLFVQSFQIRKKKEEEEDSYHHITQTFK